jgi:hypothetical protein
MKGQPVKNRKNLADVVSRKATGYDFRDTGSGNFGHSSHKPAERCYHKHPALKMPDSDLEIYGGSCLSPAVTDADIYIGFDAGMRMTDRSYPWTDGQEFLYRITDMAAPSNATDFKALVQWVSNQMHAGKKVHCGCIGGHGRTGTFFAALLASFGEPDAITYVREHYCPKAVESHEQVAFLGKHFGVSKASGSKQDTPSVHKVDKWAGAYQSTSQKDALPKPVKRFCPLPNSGSIWDRR